MAMRRIPAALAACLALAACHAGSAGEGTSVSVVPTGAERAVGSPTPEPPGTRAPDEPIPSDPGELAKTLGQVTLELRSSIEAWKASGGTAEWPPPRPLVLQALYQQRIYRVLASDPKLADQVIPLLPSEVRDEATANAAAGTALLSTLKPPDHRIHLRTRPPLPADELLGYYREAERRYGVAWQVLAAVNFVESRFGRVRSSSYASARGPMQFLSSTWRAYGLGGDVHDPHDAILGAANYLSASGAPADDRAALHAYNPVNTYVKAVSLYAHRMIRDATAFYAYYNWQVFVITPDGGSQRLTGPGV
jgi:hypothetical protein